MPGTSACSTTEATKPKGREDVSNMPGAIACHAPEPRSPTNVDSPPWHSVHTSNFSAVLQELGIAVLVTPYQAGDLAMLRTLLVVA